MRVSRRQGHENLWSCIVTRVKPFQIVYENRFMDVVARSYKIIVEDSSRTGLRARVGTNELD